MSKPVDPREDMTHEIEIGNVYLDSRHEGKDDQTYWTVVYADEMVVLLRGNDEYRRRSGLRHAAEQRDAFEKRAGSGRYEYQPEMESPVRSGSVAALERRADELADEGGRKASHKAEAMYEAIDILTDGKEADDNETVPFEDLDGVGQKTAAALRDGGYRTKGDVRRADRDELLDVSGVGEGNVSSIIEAV